MDELLAYIVGASIDLGGTRYWREREREKNELMMMLPVLADLSDVESTYRLYIYCVAVSGTTKYLLNFFQSTGCCYMYRYMTANYDDDEFFLRTTSEEN